MTEYNNISAANLTPTSNIQNGKNKLFANILPCDMNNEREEQVYNSLPPMASPCYDPAMITTNSSSIHNDGQYTEYRSTAAAGGPMSPRIPPMAFTVDFGNEDTSVADTPKKLALRDGIGRFAPSKKFRERPKSPRHIPSSAAATNLQKTPTTASTTTPANIDLLSLKNIEINQHHLAAGTAAAGHHDYNSRIDSNKQGNVGVDRSAVVMSLNNDSNEFVKDFVKLQGNSALHPTTFVTSDERVNSRDIVIDEENNIASNDATFNTTNPTLERSESDAGTYTIDNDEEENYAEEEGSDIVKNKHPQKVLNGESANIQNKGGGGVLGGGIKDEKINTNEWVNMWATNNSLIMNKDNKEEEVDDINDEQQYEDDFEEEECSMSSVRGGEGDGSRSRRKLPTVPSPKARVGINNNTLNPNVPVEAAKHDPNTDEYLKDTISLMAAMEARLSNGEDEEQRQQQHFQRSPHHSSQSRQPFHSRPVHLPQHLRPTTASAITAKPSKQMPSNSHNHIKGNVPAGSAASIEQANKAKELAAWKRRKNYDPLRAANHSKKAIGQQHQLPSTSSKRPLPQTLITNNEADVDSYSEDTCSDLDAASSVSQQAYHRQQQSANRFQPTMQARTNRAFALRQTNSLQNNDHNGPSSVNVPGPTISSSPKRTPSEESFSRSDGGRWSLRNKKNGIGKTSSSNTNSSKSAAMSSSIHRVHPSAQKKSIAVRNVMHGGRSTSRYDLIFRE